MEYKLDIELLTGWWTLGGFKLGYKHDVNRVIDKTREMLKNPEFGYQTVEKLQECKLFLGRVKTAVLQHEWGANCNDKEKQESIALIDSFVEEIEGLKSIWDIERKNDEKQPARQIKTDLTDDQRGKLYDLLAKGGFIPETDRNGFIWAMGGDKKPESFTPIKWIKLNSRTGTSNKKSLLNLLSILDVPERQIIDKHLLNGLFASPDGKSIKFTASNYTGTQKGYNSEYNERLKEIVRELQ